MNHHLSTCTQYCAILHCVCGKPALHGMRSCGSLCRGASAHPDTPLDTVTVMTTLDTHARIRALTAGRYRVMFDGREFATMGQADLVEYLHRINEPERVSYRKISSVLPRTPVVGPDRGSR